MPSTGRSAYTMEIDPPGALDSPPAPSPSLKRPKEEEVNDAATSSKRVKPEPTEPPPEGTPESSKAPKPKAEKRGEGKKGQKQRGKKGKDREKEKEFLKSYRKGTRPDGEEAAKAEDGEPKAPRLPKRPCALLLGFCGDGYNGMQMYVVFRVYGFLINIERVIDSPILSCAPSKACCLRPSSKWARSRRTIRTTQPRCVR